MFFQHGLFKDGWRDYLLWEDSTLYLNYGDDDARIHTVRSGSDSHRVIFFLEKANSSLVEA